jgi:SAM-dependent methyltransferase|tara:strand:+ start:581 stop:1336 length:756 start_codon:yes stop_codon:yes gene_type:complete
MNNFYTLFPDKYYFSRKITDKADYEESYWTEITDPDGKKRNRLLEREQYLLEDVREVLSFINSKKPGKILDVGCGLGYLLSGVSDKWSRFGVEVSSFAAKYAKEWGEIFVGELKDANFKQGYFDLIVLYHVIEHIDNPEDIIGQIYKILKDSGTLILGTPDFDSACARRFGNNYRLLHDKTHISLFSNDSMHRFLRDHNFHIDNVENPYFDTKFFAKDNLMRLFDVNSVSPPFYGNFMTFYCHKITNRFSD